MTISSPRSPTDERMAGDPTPLATTFGAGGHPSTQLATAVMLRQLTSRRRGVAVLDAGSGCGRVAQVAEALGAAVTAVDHDQAAVMATRHQVSADVLVVHAELGEFLKRGHLFDVVVANLPELELVALLPALLSARRLGGSLITTGVLLSRASRLRRRAKRLGCRPTALIALQGYVGLVFDRAQNSPTGG